MKKGLTCKIFLVIIILELSLSGVYGMVQEDEISKKPEKAIFPYALYATETGFLIGLLGSINLYEFIKEDDKYMMIGSISITQKKQIEFNLNQNYIMIDKGIQIGLDLGYKYWPDEFFEIGIDSAKDTKEDYISKVFEMGLNPQKRVLNNWSLGGIYHYGNYRLETDESAPLLNSGLILGSRGGSLSGIGFSISKDKRNSSFFTTDGEYYEMKAIFYENEFSSDYLYSLYSLDARKYYPVSDNSSIAFQFFSGYTTSGVPFQQMFKLGSFLRAYPRNRYIDRSVTIGRGEYRTFPWNGKWTKRIGVVIFSESGTVLNDFEDWRWDRQKLSLGGGFRYRLIEGEGLVLRFDAGFAEKGVNIMFLASEAF